MIFDKFSKIKRVEDLSTKFVFAKITEFLSWKFK